MWKPVVSVNIKSATVTAVDSGSEVQPRKRRAEIQLFVRDTLNVFGVGRYEKQIQMSQCCYEKRTASMDAMRMDRSQNGHMEYVKGIVYQPLTLNMHMDPRVANKASKAAAEVLIDLVEKTKQTNPSFETVSLEVHLDCLTLCSGYGTDAPIGDHGYDRLRQRLTEICSVCRRRISSNEHVVVTTCHRPYHRECVYRCFDRRPDPFPVCQPDLHLMTRGPLRLEP